MSNFVCQYRLNAELLYIMSFPLIEPIIDAMGEGKFRWLGYIMRSEPPSMLNEDENYKVKGRDHEEGLDSTWLNMDNQPDEIQYERRDAPEYVPGPTCMGNIICRLTGTRIHIWRLVSSDQT